MARTGRAFADEAVLADALDVEQTSVGRKADLAPFFKILDAPADGWAKILQYLAGPAPLRVGSCLRPEFSTQSTAPVPCVHRRAFGEARSSVGRYVKFYNAKRRQRRHKSLDGSTPDPAYSTDSPAPRQANSKGSTYLRSLSLLSSPSASCKARTYPGVCKRPGTSIGM